MKLRYLAALTILAIIFGWLLTIPAEATDPPGNDGECTHGQSHRKCPDDPQPDHGQDCESHGNNYDGNEDHCLTATPTPPTPVPSSTLTPTETPSPVPTSTSSPVPTSTVLSTSTPTATATTPVDTTIDDCTNEDGTEPRGCAVCDVNGVILNAFDYPYECSYFHISPPSTGSGGLR